MVQKFNTLIAPVLFAVLSLSSVAHAKIPDGNYFSIFGTGRSLVLSEGKARYQTYSVGEVSWNAEQTEGTFTSGFWNFKIVESINPRCPNLVWNNGNSVEKLCRYPENPDSVTPPPTDPIILAFESDEKLDANSSLRIRHGIYFSTTQTGRHVDIFSGLAEYKMFGGGEITWNNTKTYGTFHSGHWDFQIAATRPGCFQLSWREDKVGEELCLPKAPPLRQFGTIEEGFYLSNEFPFRMISVRKDDFARLFASYSARKKRKLGKKPEFVGFGQAMVTYDPETKAHTFQSGHWDFTMKPTEDGACIDLSWDLAPGNKERLCR